MKNMLIQDDNDDDDEYNNNHNNSYNGTVRHKLKWKSILNDEPESMLVKWIKKQKERKTTHISSPSFLILFFFLFVTSFPSSFNFF